MAEDLSRHLGGPHRMVWTDMQLGPSGSPRPDVYTLEKSFVRPSPTAYECKVSVSDFRADVTAAKWHSYLDYAYAVVFAAPAGLLPVKEIPPQCGLIVRHENAWRMAKRSIPVPRMIAQEALLKLLIDGVQREGPKYRAKRWHDQDTFREFAQKFGSTAARYVADAASVERDLEHAQQRRAKLLEDAEREAANLRKRAMDAMPVEWKSLLAVLDLPDGSDVWDVRRAISDLKLTKNGGEEATALRGILTSMRRTLQSNEHFIDGKQ